VADTRTPSPFASSLLFSYVANYIYDGDAPLAERRAQALSIDQEQLRDLLGDADLRELLDTDAISEVEEQLQGLLETQRVRSADGMHDLLRRYARDHAASLGADDAGQAVGRLLDYYPQTAARADAGEQTPDGDRSFGACFGDA